MESKKKFRWVQSFEIRDWNFVAYPEAMKICMEQILSVNSNRTEIKDKFVI